MARKRTRPLAGVSGEVCTKKGKKLWKEIKKDLTEPALLEMDGFVVYRDFAALFRRIAKTWIPPSNSQRQVEYNNAGTHNSTAYPYSAESQRL